MGKSWQWRSVEQRYGGVGKYPSHVNHNILIMHIIKKNNDFKKSWKPTKILFCNNNIP